MNEQYIQKSYQLARERYAELGVDVDAAIKRADALPVSMHCWQGDDVIGFDGADSLTGGIQTTGNYPGRAATPDELRTDIDEAMTLIPGSMKLNLHASYAENRAKGTDRDEYTIANFKNWVDWAKAKGIGLDFNPTYFGHPKMDGNFSLASRDDGTRRFWIEHGKRCREIADEMGRALGQTCVVNFWMPDGYKDVPADTRALRELMVKSLDEIFETQLDPAFELDAIESKLFGMGVESYTVASHEFSYGYAISRNKVYTLDSGHFHPTEVVSAKISAALQFVDKVLLHVSRGVRWDSDHVVILDNELQAIANEIMFNDYDNRVFVAQDYFDASINRIACWAIAMRNTRKALLNAALTPIAAIKKAELEGDYTSRLALLEEVKTLPFGAIWDGYCLEKGVPTGESWLAEVKRYEKQVLSAR